MGEVPFHVRRRELIALREAFDAREALLRAMTYAPPPTDTDLADELRRTVVALLSVTLRAGHTPPAGSAGLLRDETRRALVDPLTDDTVRTLTHALLDAPDGEFAASWLQELLPRYARAFDPAEALARAPAELRADVYNALAAPSLVPSLLREDVAVIAAANSALSAGADGVRAAASTLSDAVFACVGEALRYFDDPLLVDVAAAWITTHADGSDEARAQIEFAGERAVALWRDGEARALAAWLQRHGVETAWVDEPDGRAAAVEALRARLAEGGSLQKGEAALRLQCGTTRVLGADGGGLLVEDARGVWHVVSARDHVTLGPSFEGRTFAGESVRVLRRFSNLVLLGDGEGRWCTAGYEAQALSLAWNASRDDVATVERLGDALDLAGLTAQCRHGSETVTLALDADPTAYGASLAAQVRRGASVRLEHPAQPELFKDWLRAVDAHAWSTVPPQLARMGLDAANVTVTVTPVDDADRAKVPPELATPALDALWTHGCATLTAGARTLRMLTPREVMDAPTVDVAGDETVGYRALLVDERGRMVVGLGVDDGRLANDRERFLHVGRGWVTDLETAFSLALERVLLAAVTALIGRNAWDRARVDERVKLRARPKVARRASAADAWAALEKWLKKNDAGVRFKRGAPAKKLAALTALAPALPPFMLDLWKKHDGDDESGSLGGWSMMGVENIVDEHAFWMAFTSEAPPPDDALPAVWWQASWVPFASSGGGDFLAVDTSPEGQGRVFVLLMDPPFRRVLAPSFEDFVIELVHAIEREDITCEGGDWSGFDTFLTGPEGVEA